MSLPREGGNVDFFHRKRSTGPKGSLSRARSPKNLYRFFRGPHRARWRRRATEGVKGERETAGEKTGRRNSFRRGKPRHRPVGVPGKVRRTFWGFGPSRGRLIKLLPSKLRFDTSLGEGGYKDSFHRKRSPVPNGSLLRELAPAGRLKESGEEGETREKRQRGKTPSTASGPPPSGGRLTGTPSAEGRANRKTPGPYRAFFDPREDMNALYCAKGKSRPIRTGRLLRKERL